MPMCPPKPSPSVFSPMEDAEFDSTGVCLWADSAGANSIILQTLSAETDFIKHVIWS